MTYDGYGEGVKAAQRIFRCITNFMDQRIATKFGFMRQKNS